MKTIRGTGPNTVWFDPSAFAPVTQVRFGNSGKNTLRGPGLVNLDLGLFRAFRVTERIQMLIRAEAYNSTNTPHWALPAANISAVTYNVDGSVRSLGGFGSTTATDSSYLGRAGMDERTSGLASIFHSEFAERRGRENSQPQKNLFTMRTLLLTALATALLALRVRGSEPILVPQIDGEFWTVAGDPDLGKYTTAKQQPVDFGIWQAADGTWQLWSCIRGTAAPGKTRLFYRWQGKKLEDKNWAPMGIAMEADPGFGETEGGLQAPFVLKDDASYYMFYGDWEHISLAKSMDGKTFARQLMPNGVSGMFGEGVGTNTRDPMVLKIGSLYYCYYTAYPNRQGADFVRTSPDKIHWSEPQKVVYGGSQGNGPYSAECPFVYFHRPSGYYYLLRNQVYGEHAQFAVYRSKNPLDFGKDNDQYLVETMPYAAPEIIESEGQLYMATLRPNLKGIQIAKLTFAPKEAK